MAGTVTLGDTIRLTAAFADFDGVAGDPTHVTLKIYDTQRAVLATVESSDGVMVNSTVGTYYYDYTTVIEGTHIYEFEGVLAGKTISDKSTFYVTWA